jgi:hypothetical protein
MQITQQFIKGFKKKLIIKKIKCEKESAKKRSFSSNFSISKFFASKDPLKKNDVEQKMFVEILALFILKNHLLLQFVESVWLKYSVLQLCPHV